MRSENPIEHFSRHSRELGPIPVRYGKFPVPTQFSNGLLESAKITTMPSEEPPVSMWAVKEMDEGVTKPILWVIRGQSQHHLDALGVALKGLFSLSTRDIVSGKPRTR